MSRRRSQGAREGRRPRPSETEGAPAPSLRTRILDGAAEAFGRKGYAETRVEDILEAAGVSRPTYYKFFANKDEAFHTLAEMTILSLIRTVRGAVGAAESAPEKLERGVEAYLRWRVSTGPFGRVLDAESRVPGSFAGSQRREALAAITEIFAEEVSKARRTGVDPLLYIGLVSALEAIGATLHDLARPTEKDIRRRKDAMMRLLVGTLLSGERRAPKTA